MMYLAAWRKYYKNPNLWLRPTRRRLSEGAGDLLVEDWNYIAPYAVWREVEGSWDEFHAKSEYKRTKARCRFYFEYAYKKTEEDLENSDRWRQDLWYVPIIWRRRKVWKFYNKELIAG